MNAKIESIKSFILAEKEYFNEGVDIPTFRRRYKQQTGLKLGRPDAVDALLHLRKEGVLKNDFKDIKMKFVK